MAAPSVASVGSVSNGTSGASVNVPMPSGITAGDLLITFAVVNSTAFYYPVHAGWSELASFETAAPGFGTARMLIFAKLAAGSDSLTLTMASEDYVAQCLRITGHGLDDVSQLVIAAASGTSTAPDSPDLSLASDDYLIISAAGVSFDNAGNSISAGPSGYSVVSNTKSANSTSSVGLGIATVARTGITSESMPAWTSSSRPWVAWSVAVQATNEPAVKVASSSTGSGSDSTATASMPSGTTSGDLLIAHLAVASASAITTPSGWTVLESQTQGSMRLVVYARLATGSDSFSASVSLNWVLHIQRITGHNVATIASDIVSDVAAASNDTPNAPSVSVTSGAYVVLVSTLGRFSASGGAIRGIPSGFVGDVNTASPWTFTGASLAVDHRYARSVTSVDPSYTNLNGSGTQWAAATTAIPSGASGGGGTEVEGTASASFAGFAAAASGVPSTTGTAAATFAGFAGTASGAPATQGTASATFAGFTASAGGDVTVVAEASASFAGWAATASGEGITPPVEGAATATFAGFEAAATGAPTTLGIAAATFDGFAATAAGARSTEGTAEASFEGWEATAEGRTSSTAAGDASFTGFTAAATGQVHVTGTASTSFAGWAGTAEGGVPSDSIEGEASATFAGPVCTATGKRRVVGTARCTASGFTATATGQVHVTGAASASFTGWAGTAAGTRHTTGTATASFAGWVGTVTVAPEGTTLRTRLSGRRPDRTVTGTRPRRRLSGRRSSTR